jgi:YggT family protein
MNRGNVADYVSTLILVYTILIFIRILLTWIPRVPYNRFLAAAIAFVTDVVDPYLNLFRRFLPPVRIGPGALDLSPIVGLVVLQVVGAIVIGAIRG